MSGDLHLARRVLRYLFEKQLALQILAGSDGTVNPCSRLLRRTTSRLPPSLTPQTMKRGLGAAARLSG
jgi:hypothetical protein